MYTFRESNSFIFIFVDNAPAYLRVGSFAIVNHIILRTGIETLRDQKKKKTFSEVQRDYEIMMSVVSDFSLMLSRREEFSLRPVPEVIKLFPCSTQMSMKF